MAKKKLFGNAPEPRCETCAHGRASSEGDVILCKRAGAVPPYHHCRRFRYDPLKRTPHRTMPIETFDEEAFSLEIIAEPAEVVPPEVIEAEKAVQDALIEQTLVVEAEAPAATDDDEIIETADTAETPAIVHAEEVTEEVADDEITIEPPTAPDPDVLIPDDSDDIFGDLARLNVEVLKSATHAAFQNFDPKMMAFEEYKAEDIDDGLSESFDPSLLTLHDNGEEDEPPLATGDLILLNKAALDDSLDDTEMLTMNPDGTFSGHPAE